MLALRLTRGGRPAVQLRRLLVALASGGTAFLLLCTLGYALGHPLQSGAAALRLAWCAVPLAATVHLATAVARTDPGTRPRPGLSAVGLGPGRLMAISALTTALACTVGSALALLLFLHLRGDVTGLPFDGAAARFLAGDVPLPLPATLTLLALLPVTASVAVAVVLRPRERRSGAAAGRGISAAYRPFRARGGSGGRTAVARAGSGDRAPAAKTADDGRTPAGPETADGAAAAGPDTADGPTGAGSGGRTSALRGGSRGRTPAVRGRISGPGPAAQAATGPTADGVADAVAGAVPAGAVLDAGALLAAADGAAAGRPDPHRPPVPREAPRGLPWGVAVLAVGLAVEAYASRTTAGTALALPGALPGGPVGVFFGWALTALGLALAGPGLTHLCGRLLQAVRPGALRLLAGRILMAEATRVGRPLGVVCAVASGGYAMASLSDPHGPSIGPLTTLGTLVVAGCTVATLLTAAVEAKHARAETTAALVRLGAPASMLRGAAALRAGALLAVFGPLTLAVADLAALPLAH
ncbi:hypothetical protein [Streptomyces mangrovisoli]|uniref:Uncharacterized protein n=1 Tax=Streptomyces mangrovisoli TaxID=1428628 RepID=A0A1J4NLZ7_9ACTN|nr:hypothetical protein [Streptomyces mangrovisoli]OIJ63331.1 hypothetical protein WN71_034805 [Streptomyces mangrovisoli]